MTDPNTHLDDDNLPTRRIRRSGPLCQSNNHHPTLTVHLTLSSRQRDHLDPITPTPTPTRSRRDRDNLHPRLIPRNSPSLCIRGGDRRRNITRDHTHSSLRSDRLRPRWVLVRARPGAPARRDSDGRTGDNNRTAWSNDNRRPWTIVVVPLRRGGRRYHSRTRRRRTSGLRSRRPRRRLFLSGRRSCRSRARGHDGRRSGRRYRFTRLSLGRADHLRGRRLQIKRTSAWYISHLRFPSASNPRKAAFTHSPRLPRTSS